MRLCPDHLFRLFQLIELELESIETPEVQKTQVFGKNRPSLTNLEQTLKHLKTKDFFLEASLSFYMFNIFGIKSF